MKIAIVCAERSNNSMGRAYSLWLLAKELGWSAVVISTIGEQLWKPLRGTGFEKDLVKSKPSEVQTHPAYETADVIVIVKPHPESLGRLLHDVEQGLKPFILDIDDPDLEVRLSWASPARRIVRELRRPEDFRLLRRMQRVARSMPTTVSNPWLQNRYGGALIPHVRHDPGRGSPPRGPVNIAFVGTNRPHKGVELLRSAVAELHNDGFTLTITDVAPSDAQPWENWVGETSLTDGMNLVAASDLVVIPSVRGGWARGQFPVKIVDAMMMERPVIVSNVPPLPWAIDDSRAVFRAGSRRSLVRTLQTVAPSRVRAEMGARNRARALATFSVEAVAPRFAEAVYAALRHERPAR